MDLVERDTLLAEVTAEAGAAARGHGRMVVLAGPAGIGKTTLARAAIDRIPGAPRILWGACDALATPRPLGPLRDMAETLIGWREALDGPPEGWRRQVLDDLGRRYTVMVIEDLHWADEATIDFVRWLGRRLERTRALLVVTLRDDEMGPFHPAQVAMGDLATSHVLRRLRVKPLSPAGVALLAAGHDADAAEVHRITGGNPFYVTEVLASGEDGVPPNVSDAVLARVARLDPMTVDVLATASVEPGPLDLRLLKSLGHPDRAVEDALASGMMVADGVRVRFRHELARLAVQDMLDALRRRQLHEGLFRALEAEGGHDAARLANHAQGAGLEEAAASWAEKAGRAAVVAGAHREAASHYAVALTANVGRTDEERAELVAAYASELEALDRVEEAIEARRELVALRGEGPEAAAAAGDLAAALWRDGRGEDQVGGVRLEGAVEAIGRDRRALGGAVGLHPGRCDRSPPGDVIDEVADEHVGVAIGVARDQVGCLRPEGDAVSWTADRGVERGAVRLGPARRHRYALGRSRDAVVGEDVDFVVGVSRHQVGGPRVVGDEPPLVREGRLVRPRRRLEAGRRNGHHFRLTGGAQPHAAQKPDQCRHRQARAAQEAAGRDPFSHLQVLSPVPG